MPYILRKVVSCYGLKKVLRRLKMRVFVLMLVLALYQSSAVCEEKKQSLLCHVGGTMRPAMEQIAKAYEKDTGNKVEVNSADSGELIAHIELQRNGDLYVCHDPFMDQLMTKKLGVDAWTIAELVPVIAVKKGNPKKIAGLQDLTRPEVSLVFPDYEASTLGHILPSIFKKGGVDFEKLNKEKKVVLNRSGSYAANYVVTGNADATIVWNAVAFLRSKDLDVIDISEALPRPDIDTVTSATNKTYRLMPVRVTVSTLTVSKDLGAASKFAEYIGSDKASAILASFGFTIDKAHLKKEYENGSKVVTKESGK